MPNIQGTWKQEWQRRVGYFDKEVGKSEKRIDKVDTSTPKQKKKWNFWSKIAKSKKTHETDLEKLFGQLDLLYAKIDQHDLDGAQRKKLMAAFLQALKQTAKKANAYTVKEFMSLTNAALAKDMPADLLAHKKQEIKSLSKILQDDVDALITSAHTWHTAHAATMDRDGNIDTGKVLRSTFDPKMLKMKTVTCLKKAAAWLAKAERNPVPDVFNKGAPGMCRDVMAPFAQFSGAAPQVARNVDTRTAKRLQDYLGPIGQGKRTLANDASPEEVAARLAELKQVLALTARWVNGVRL